MPICLAQTIIHVSDRLHTAPPPPRQRTPRPQGLSLGTLNIRNGWGFRITQAIRVVHIGGFVLMILTETKITNQSSYHISMGYKLVCPPMITMEAGGAQWGVCLVIRDQPQGWSVELTRFHRTNLMSCEVSTN